MGGLTPQKKKLSSSKMSKKALKCTVQMEIKAITCPGVVLPNQEDIYLSVCVMGQFKKTLCLPPVFPLLFHEKMVFVKTFTGAADPGHIVDILEADTTSFELIQLVPPEGDILATIEENTREFLYPGPKLTPRAGGPEREMLMRRSICFPGISPKVEFATMSVIEECDGKDSQPQPASPPCCSPSPARPSPARRRPVSRAVGSPRQTLKGKDLSLTGPSSGYEQPTVASQARAPSPYTHRRMCQLSEEARQRLSYLQLGPYRFKKETEPQIPFVVSSTLSASMMETPSRLSSKRSLPHSRSTSFAADNSGDFSLLGSYRPTPVKVGTGCLKNQKSPGKSSRQDCSRTTVRMARSALAAQSSTPVCGPRSPLLSRTSLRERFHSSASSPSKEIHSRVQKILHTHATDRKLHFDEDGCSAKRGPQLSCEDSLCDSQAFQDRDTTGETSVHLDNGTLWSSQVARYTGKHHRAVFEDSLGLIYKNLYRRASSTT
ncbi:spermatogenesis-associated protein 6 [Coregonus clupeaformis]|uniref:spermatogenesis-associated protein 6 n=1 Tax=Coregonus clupeaformis TaxID=59861 RepID=UPI001E1C526D|nr:spermatogenesis-associated protein 6 [Coregonus clupeaformis]